MYPKKRERAEEIEGCGPPPFKMQNTKTERLKMSIGNVLDQFSDTSDPSRIFAFQSMIRTLSPLSSDDVCLVLHKLLQIFETSHDVCSRSMAVNLSCQVASENDMTSTSANIASLIQMVIDLIEEGGMKKDGTLIPLLLKMVLLLNCDTPLFQNVLSLLREKLNTSRIPLIRMKCLEAVTQMALKMKHGGRQADVKPSSASLVDMETEESEAEHNLDSNGAPEAAPANLSEPEIESILFSCASDVEYHVRLKAVECLCLYRDSGFKLSFENYGIVCKMLEDHFFMVRFNSLELLVTYAALYPENLVESLNEGTELRLIDDVFLRLSVAMQDESIQMRTRAATLMGTMKNVSERFLEQMLDKQLMCNMLSSDASSFEDIVAKSSTGYRAEPSIPIELIILDSAFVMPQRASGSFVLGLEDEHKDVRNACVWSTCQLAAESVSFAQKSMNMLLDVFNDEIEEVRLTLIRHLSKPLLHVVLTEDQLEVIITALHNASSEVHETICNLLSNCRVYSPQCLQMALQAFVACVKQCPEKQESAFGCIRELGKNNFNLVLSITQDLLGLNPFMDMPGTSLEDYNSTAKLILVFSAARYCPTMHSVIRRYALCHYDYLHTTPDIAPLLKDPSKDGNTSGRSLQANFPKLMKILETSLNLCQKLPFASRMVTLAAIVRNLEHYTDENEKINKRIRCMTLCFQTIIQTEKILADHLRSSGADFYAGQVIKVLESVLELQYCWYSEKNELQSLIVELRLRIGVIMVMHDAQWRPWLMDFLNDFSVINSTTGPSFREIASAVRACFGEFDAEFKFSSAQEIISMLSRHSLPLFPISEDVYRKNVNIVEPRRSSRAVHQFFSHFDVAVPFVAHLSDFPECDLDSVRIKVVYPDQSEVIVCPHKSSFHATGENSFTLRTEVFLSDSAWTSKASVELSLLLLVPEKNLPLKRLLQVQLCPSVSVSIYPRKQFWQ